jgi:hypothetical protein
MGMFRMGFRTCLLAALVLGHTPGGWVSSARSKNPRCLGKEATIIGTEKDDDLQGTKAADVILFVTIQCSPGDSVL